MKRKKRENASVRRTRGSPHLAIRQIGGEKLIWSTWPTWPSHRTRGTTLNRFVYPTLSSQTGKPHSLVGSLRKETPKTSEWNKSIFTHEKKKNVRLHETLTGNGNTSCYAVHFVLADTIAYAGSKKRQLVVSAERPACYRPLVIGLARHDATP